MVDIISDKIAITDIDKTPTIERALEILLPPELTTNLDNFPASPDPSYLVGIREYKRQILNMQNAFSKLFFEPTTTHSPTKNEIRSYLISRRDLAKTGLRLYTDARNAGIDVNSLPIGIDANLANQTKYLGWAVNSLSDGTIKETEGQDKGVYKVIEIISQDAQSLSERVKTIFKAKALKRLRVSKGRISEGLGSQSLLLNDQLQLLYGNIIFGARQTVTSVSHLSKNNLGQNEITREAEKHIDSLFRGILDTNPDFVYFSFPEDKVKQETIIVGEKDPQVIDQELISEGYGISPEARKMIHSKNFVTLNQPAEINLIYLRVDDLGYTKPPTTNEIYEKAKHLGFNLCPPEVAPALRLKYTNQPQGEHLYVAMKPMAGSSNVPAILGLVCLENGPYLIDQWAANNRKWPLDSKFVFRL